MPALAYLNSKYYKDGLKIWCFTTEQVGEGGHDRWGVNRDMCVSALDPPLTNLPPKKTHRAPSRRTPTASSASSTTSSTASGSTPTPSSSTRSTSCVVCALAAVAGAVYFFCVCLGLGGRRRKAGRSKIYLRYRLKTRTNQPPFFLKKKNNRWASARTRFTSSCV